ncbi:hypothetical protein VTN96DRAFT_899 [Rasamsonia emersonii]
MLFTKLVCSLAALATAVSALPLQSRQNQNKGVVLRTTGGHNPQHNDLYVVPYHTGAGLNDAVLTTNITKAAQFSWNGTTLQYNTGQSFSWGLNLAPDTNYAAWEPVTIDAGSATAGISINGSYVTVNGPEFDGWLVCDWYHDAPQLFWAVARYSHYGYPSTCSKVQLVAQQATQ